MMCVQKDAALTNTIRSSSWSRLIVGILLDVVVCQHKHTGFFGSYWHSNGTLSYVFVLVEKYYYIDRTIAIITTHLLLVVADCNYLNKKFLKIVNL